LRLETTPTFAKRRANVPLLQKEGIFDLLTAPSFVEHKLHHFLCTFQRKLLRSFAQRKGAIVEQSKSEVLQGTLDLMILKALDALGPLHGYGIARRLEQISNEMLRLNEGTVYTALLRLQQQGWITSEWGSSENNRKAKYYSITKAGRKQLAHETKSWERIAGVVDRVLRLQGE
jgi:PadR family transcriptional regulator, regulatory protein PadR